MPMMITTLEKTPGCGCGKNFCSNIEHLREEEYPYLKGSIYLDHAGSALYAASLVKSFSHEMTSNLYGNPHSLSSSSQRSTNSIEDVRLRTLAFFNADPDDYDLVFVANATSAIKLVAESFRDFESRGFQYGYHVDSHTSLVGLRELATIDDWCLDDGDVQDWISEHCTAPAGPPTLFAFPAQSNLNGRRLPVSWCRQIRAAAGNERGNVFSLLDAASYVSTAPLDVNKIAPDFVALSFYKIFGFPDLGALIVRKGAVHALDGRKFFGGGTVDMVIALGDTWHAKRQTSIHERFEDGTLPFHNIIALGVAFGTHERLYGSMANISVHTGWLAKEAYDRLSTLRHFNGTKVCQMYRSEYGNAQLQGPIIAFNLQNSRGEWIPKTAVETLAATRDIQLRSGSVCNPGGIASSLGWADTDLRRHYTAGLRCGDDHDVLDGRPTGVLRVSLGAMNSHKDIQALVRFVRDTYMENAPYSKYLTVPLLNGRYSAAQFFVESLTVFPILGCGGLNIPKGSRWEIHENGLAWDHAWCLVHENTNEILDSQTYPQMLRVCPTVQLDQRVLCLSYTKWTGTGRFNVAIPLPVTAPNRLTMPIAESAMRRNDKLHLQKYKSSSVKTFFSKVLGVPCTLAMLCSQQTHGSLHQLPPNARRDRLRLRNIVGQKTYWPHSSSSIKRESSPCSSSPSIENCTSIVVKSSVICEPVTSPSELENEKSIKHSVISHETLANILIGEQTTGSIRAQYTSIQKDWSAICIGPIPVHFDSVRTGGSEDDESSTISEAVRVSVRQLNGHIIHENYQIRSAGADNCRRTIAVGDMVVPH